MSKNAISILVIFIISVLYLFLSFNRLQETKKTISKENLISVTIARIDCNQSHGRSSLIFKYNDGIHHANLTYNQCLKYKIGDQVQLYYNQNYEWYIIKDSGYESEDKSAIIIACIIITTIFIYWSYKLYLKLSKK
ncbi:hypothetical protein DVR12_02285 [Chitinophaga silvatica]|uniref:DUF3592 domain-containing protein n=1 Tax=Chitinophaga silvatica TaxID=2282649 RepID=A0A3E1YGZ9_9BACT|nr:hypothetical protein DVR12_02285 [Chitinophaga silvatica]